MGVIGAYLEEGQRYGLPPPQDEFSGNMGGGSITNANWMNCTSASISQLYVKGENSTAAIYYPQTEASVIIQQSGSNYIALNGTTKTIIYQGTNIVALIQKVAVNGGHIAFDAGTYDLSQRMYLRNINNLVISGEGAKTIFRVNNKVFSTLNAVAASGTNTITLTSVTGFEVGQDIFIGSNVSGAQVWVTETAPYYELQRYIGPQGESNIITSINGNTLTLFYSLTNSYIDGEPVWTIYDAFYFDHCNNLKVTNIALNGNAANQSPCNGDIFQNGIRLRGCIDAEIYGNYVYNVVYNQIMLHPNPSLKANIHDNIVYYDVGIPQSQNRGITVESSSSGTTVINNKINGGWTGLYDVGTIADFSHNFINNTYTYGILTAPSNFVPMTIAENIITNSQFYGIDCRSSYTNIVGNTIYDNQKTCIRLYGTNNSNVLNNVIINGGLKTTATYCAILITPAGAGLNNWVKGNQISQTGANTYNYAIAAESGCVGTVIEDNKIANTQTPAIINSGGGLSRTSNNIGYVTENSKCRQHLTQLQLSCLQPSLSYTPSAGDIMITPITNLSNCTSYSIDTYTSNHATIHLYDATGTAKWPATTVSFSWSATKRH